MPEIVSSLTQLRAQLLADPFEPARHIALAKALVASGNLGTARNILDIAAALSDGITSVADDLFTLMLRTDAPVSARNLLAELSSKAPLSIADQCQLGHLQALTGQSEQALATLAPVLIAEPANQTALVTTSRIAMMLGDISKAEAIAKTLLHFHPKNPQTHDLLGSIAAAKRRPADSETTLWQSS